jgi:hypothetical protein
MDINLTILKSAALVAEKSEYSEEASEYSEEASEYSEEAQLEDEMPDDCKNDNKGENECA